MRETTAFFSAESKLKAAPRKSSRRRPLDMWEALRKPRHLPTELPVLQRTWCYSFLGTVDGQPACVPLVGCMLFVRGVAFLSAPPLLPHHRDCQPANRRENDVAETGVGARMTAMTRFADVVWWWRHIYAPAVGVSSDQQPPSPRDQPYT
jgi:hypothetical protein